MHHARTSTIKRFEINKRIACIMQDKGWLIRRALELQPQCLSPPPKAHKHSHSAADGGTNARGAYILENLEMREEDFVRKPATLGVARSQGYWLASMKWNIV
jgi:hypothetical protein